MKTYCWIAVLGLLLSGACQRVRNTRNPGTPSYFEATENGISGAKRYPSKSMLVGVREGLALTATFYLLGPRQDTTGHPAFRYRVKLHLKNLNDHEVIFFQPLRVAVPLRDEPRIAYADFPTAHLPISGEMETYYEMTLLAGQPLPKPKFHITPVTSSVRRQPADRKP